MCLTRGGVSVCGNVRSVCVFLRGGVCVVKA